jgi:hypothetical protein
VLESFRNSPRQQKRAFFASLAILAAGIVALLVVVVFPSSDHRLNTPISSIPAQKVKNDPAAKVDPKAVAIAREFLLTAVQRKNLDWAYNNVHVDLKGRMSRAEWDKGTIPVIPCDAQNATTTAFIPSFSLKEEVEFDVTLIPKAHSIYCGDRPVRFFIALRREHDSPTGRWLVSYWEPHWKPPLPLTQN